MIHLYQDDGGIAQRFQLKELPDGSYQIREACTDNKKCLTNYGGKLGNSVPVTSNGINGTHSDQSWFFEPVEAGKGSVPPGLIRQAGAMRLPRPMPAGLRSRIPMGTGGCSPESATRREIRKTREYAKETYQYDSRDRLTGVSRSLEMRRRGSPMPIRETSWLPSPITGFPTAFRRTSGGIRGRRTWAERN